MDRFMKIGQTYEGNFDGVLFWTVFFKIYYINTLAIWRRNAVEGAWVYHYIMTYQWYKVQAVMPFLKTFETVPVKNDSAKSHCHCKKSL